MLLRITFNQKKFFMKYLNLITLALLMTIGTVYAQTTVTGAVTTEAGDPIIGANVLVKGSSPIIGAITDFDGNYQIMVPEGYEVLSYSYVGYASQDIEVAGQTTINVTLVEGVEVNKVVVTALGLSREEKALGYATQEVSGDDLNKAREVNVVNSLQGKVAGVQITGSSNLGGSSRMVIRGAGSITGNNQPLFVVDGVPLDNANHTNADQERGAGGYDYGNAIQDLNPDDIESINVLKGPTAAALYGNRAANGVVIITTKKGKNMSAKNAPIGVSVNSSIQFNNVYVLPSYQNQYGGGAGSSFANSVIDTNQLVADMAYDGSWGPAYNGQQVRQWDSYDEWDTENFGKTREWKANPDNVKDFFRTGITASNSVSLGGASEKGSFRLGFTNTQQKGTQENSSLNRNNISFSSSLNLSDKLTASANVNIVNSKANGRPLTGYGESVMSQFNQWFQRQLDMDRLRNYQNPDGSMRTWNRTSELDGSAKYWDNPFWERYENGQKDSRNRVFGNVALSYTFNDKFSVTGRAMTDFYTDRREEWVAVGGVRVPMYSEDVRFFQENNYDLIGNYKDRFGDFSVSGMVGMNYRRTTAERNYASTQGGLNTPGLYNLSNSASELTSTDATSELAIFSIFEQATLGYKDFVYLDLTNRTDINSTLPLDRNTYNYYSASASLVFSELIPANEILSFGKFRAGYAVVGNGTTPYNLQNTYISNANFNGNGTATVPNSLLNEDLKPERTSGFEAGLDLRFLKDRLGVDFTYYSNVTKDQIFNVSQSGATGYTSRSINAGKVANRGIELMLYATPVKTKDFKWDLSLNLGKNNNEVLELATGTDNIRLTSLFGVALDARVGESYGTLMGTDYVYDANGNKIVEDGVYLVSDVKPLGSVLPDFTGGFSSTFSYKRISLFLLFDFQKGGKLFSLSNQWGKYSGTLEETVIETDVNGVTDNIRNQGIIVEGSNVLRDGNGDYVLDADGNYQSDGTENTTVLDAQSHFFLNQGYVINAADVYDASFIKFREARISYTFSNKLFEGTRFRDLSLSLVGRNLAILHRNIPNIDPEAAINSGNVQGFEGGQLPTERSIGVNLNVKF